MKTVISFSGGKTSAFMTRMLTAIESIDPLVVFANTGQERNETLDFVHRCDEEWGLNVVWIESVTHHREHKGCTHRVVDYWSASRNGEPFEDMIKKYGIPNKVWPHCTRELKLNPIYSYLKSIGLRDYQMAIGIRADERNRAIEESKRGKIIYPLIDTWPITKRMVNEWWELQPFNLNLKDFEGNCAWCWKKSIKKHFALIENNPQIFDFPRRMERDYGMAGHNKNGEPRVFFRGGLSTNDLFNLYSEERCHNQSLDVDADESCEESCDIHALMKDEKCSGV